MTTKSLQIVAERAGRQSTGVSEEDNVFYSSKDYKYPIPDNLSSVKLCGNSDGTGQTSVDDKLVILINGTSVYEHDYGQAVNGRITPLDPQDLIGKFEPHQGNSIDIEARCIDILGSNMGALNVYLVFGFAE